MGRYGQAILTIVGTVVGAYFGYPALGAALGSLAGQLLFPTQLPTQQGPRLSDLSQTQSSVGVAIPEGWGCFSVAGTIIHYTKAREVIESEEVGGGSGGPTQTVETPTYYSDFGVSLVDCPRRPILGVRRIWANGKAIYDRRAIQSGEGTGEFQARMAANAQLDEIMTVYLGTDTQEPDPTLEAFHGVGNVSAHLNLAWIMFAGWKHKPEDGNRIPAQLKFEVITEGAVSEDAAVEYSNEVLYPWHDADDPISERNDHEYVVQGAGNTVPGNSWTLREEAIEYGAAILGVTSAGYMGHGLFGGGGSTPLITTRFGGAISAHEQDAQTICLHYNHQDANRYIAEDTIIGASTCDNFGYLFLGGNRDPVHTNAFPFFGSSSLFQVTAPVAGSSPGVAPEGWQGVYDDCFEFSGHPFNYLTSWDIEIRAIRIPRAPDDPGSPRGLAPPLNVPGLDDFVIVNGAITRVGPWTLVTGASQDFAVLASYHTASVGGNSSGTVSQYPLNPCVPHTQANYSSQAFWEAQYQIAVGVGSMPAGLTYGVGYPILQPWGYVRSLDTTTLEAVPVDVLTTVEDMALDAGYELDQIDGADIAALQMTGYVRTRVMTFRAALDPLRQAKFFDGYESGRTVRFTRRGGPIRHTFALDELGVFVSGGERPSRITTDKTQDVDLPRQVRVHYLSPARDYEPGEQQSLARVGTKAVNDVDVELPMVLTDTEAKQIAQILWADAWIGRHTHAIQTSMRYKALEPTDCVAVPVDGEYVRCRIVDITDQLPSVRKYTLARDDDGSYVSYAVADEPPNIPPVLSIASPAAMIALDIPLIRDADDDPGFYVAVYPLIRGAFAGAAIYRSTDGGGNFAKVGAVQNMAYTGVLLEQLGEASYATVDGTNRILVEMDNGALESITRAAMLNGSTGSNAAAIGQDGRWEIVQFQDVEALTDRIFSCTVLLRGRRGTEHNIGTSVAGDRFVLLTGPGIIRVPLQLSDVGRQYLYRAVGTGVSLDSAEDVLFACNAVALKPFSPVFIRGERDPNTADWTITAIRRGRIGQTLPGAAEIPLSEEVEDYEFVVRDADGVELRVMSAIEPEVVYTGSMQITDFGTYKNPLAVEVYQISASVGRGYVGTATLSSGVPVLLPPDLASFAARSLDEPTTMFYANGKHHMIRAGDRGSAPALGLYRGDATTAPTFVDDTYDGRNGPTGSYIPEFYNRLVVTAMHSGASNGRLVLHWNEILVDPQTSGPTARWLFTQDGSTGELVPVPTNASIQSQWIVGVHAKAASYYAVTVGPPPKVWTSTDGLIWTQGASLTGSIPSIEEGTFLRFFEFGGAVYAFGGGGLYRNAAGDFVDWTAIALLGGAYSQRSYRGIAITATAIVIISEGLLTADLTRHNIILRSTDGTTFASVRDVDQAADFPSGFAYELEWDHIVAFGTGFCIYGKNPFSGALPWVLKSTDDGATWTMSELNTGDATKSAIVYSASSAAGASRVVATIGNRFVDSGGGGVINYPQLNKSSDGIAFTALTF